MSGDRLSGRTAVITGAANGGGAASATLFAEQGAHVVIVDIDDGAGKSLCRSLLSSGLSAEYVHADVSLPSEVDQLFEQIDELDILFNHAGTVIVRPLVDTSVSEWERLMRVNVTSMFLTCRAVLPRMAERRAGVILNTSSISGFTASPYESAYCASKGAVLQLSRAIAVEYRDRGVRCNAICPGFIRTDHGLREMAALSALGIEVSERTIVASQGRFCEPEEFAATALALVTDDTRFLNGAAVVVDNGSTVLT